MLYPTELPNYIYKILLQNLKLVLRKKIITSHGLKRRMLYPAELLR